MPDVIFIGLFFVLVLCQIIALGIYFDPSFKLKSIIPNLIFGIISVPLIIWFTLYLSSPKTIRKEFILPIYTVEDSQFIYYEDNMINVNKKFGRSFQDDDKIKVTAYNRCYYGVDMCIIDSHNDYEVVE